MVAKGSTRPATPFCQNCHVPAAYARANPHLMVVSETEGNTRLLEEQCLVCHDRKMPADVQARTGKASLRGAEAALCQDCHVGHRDEILTAHVGKPLNAERQAYMYAREVTGLWSKPTEKLLAQLKADGRRPTQMPPDTNGAINCSTCHNPHLSGTFPKESVLTSRAMRLTESGVASPVRGKSWCRHCHAEF
jgi:hypothetical protein